MFSHDEGFEEEEGKVSLLPHNSRNISAISYFPHNHDESNGSLKVGCLYLKLAYIYANFIYVQILISNSIHFCCWDQFLVVFAMPNPYVENLKMGFTTRQQINEEANNACKLTKHTTHYLDPNPSLKFLRPPPIMVKTAERA